MRQSDYARDRLSGDRHSGERGVGAHDPRTEDRGCSRDEGGGTSDHHRGGGALGHGGPSKALTCETLAPMITSVALFQSTVEASR